MSTTPLWSCAEHFQPELLELEEWFRKGRVYEFAEPPTGSFSGLFSKSARTAKQFSRSMGLDEKYASQYVLRSLLENKLKDSRFRDSNRGRLKQMSSTLKSLRELGGLPENQIELIRDIFVGLALLSPVSSTPLLANAHRAFSSLASRRSWTFLEEIPDSFSTIDRTLYLVAFRNAFLQFVESQIFNPLEVYPRFVPNRWKSALGQKINGIINMEDFLLNHYSSVRGLPTELLLENLFPKLRFSENSAYQAIEERLVSLYENEIFKMVSKSFGEERNNFIVESIVFLGNIQTESSRARPVSYLFFHSLGGTLAEVRHVHQAIPKLLQTHHQFFGQVTDHQLSDLRKVDFLLQNEVDLVAILNEKLGERDSSCFNFFKSLLLIPLAWENLSVTSLLVDYAKSVDKLGSDEAFAKGAQFLQELKQERVEVIIQTREEEEFVRALNRLMIRI